MNRCRYLLSQCPLPGCRAILKLLCAAILAPTIAGTSVRAELIGVAWHATDSPVYSIDETTGAGTLIGYSGVAGLNALASDAEGTLYSVTQSPSDSAQYLLTINRDSGVATIRATLSGLAEPSIRGMAFSADGVLYAIQNGDGISGTLLDDQLVTINTSNGNVSLVGTTLGSNSLQALDFASTGTLYSWDRDVGLVTIDPDSGAVNNAFANDSGGIMQSLLVSSDGNAYGWSHGFLSINLSNGELTQLGGDFADIRGLELRAVPEPGTLVLLAIGVGLGAVLVMRNRLRVPVPTQ